MNSVLVTQPVGTLDGIVHVPSPVVLVHVTEGGVDTTLSSDSVASGREQLGDTGSVETGLSKTEGGSQTGTTSTNDEGIVLVVLGKSVNWRDSNDSWPRGQAGGRHTMTAYLVLTKGDASLARRGPLAMTRAVEDPGQHVAAIREIRSRCHTNWSGSRESSGRKPRGPRELFSMVSKAQ